MKTYLLATLTIFFITSCTKPPQYCIKKSCIEVEKSVEILALKNKKSIFNKHKYTDLETDDTYHVKLNKMKVGGDEYIFLKGLHSGLAKLYYTKEGKRVDSFEVVVR